MDPRIPVRKTNLTRRPCKFGHTPDGRYIIVVYDEVAPRGPTVRPTTAYEVPEPRVRR